MLRLRLRRTVPSFALGEAPKVASAAGVAGGVPAQPRTLPGAEPGCSVGIRRAENSASNAIRASTTSAARRPSSLACWLASRAAVAVSWLVPAWSSAAWRSASEMNGTPPASSTLAWAFTESGTAGFCWIPVRNEVVSAAIRIEPARAVPIEAPRLVPVFCSPPTSGLSSSGTADTVTLPSWEASAPIPSPASSSGTVTISAPAAGSMLANRATMPTSMASSPSRTTRRARRRARTAGCQRQPRAR